MKFYFLVCCQILYFSVCFSQKQAVWEIAADKIDSSAYYGETVANGMIGIVSSPVPLRCDMTVLNGAYDVYGRGGVSNILKSFNLLNMAMVIDGKSVGWANVKNLQQMLDMKNGCFAVRFDCEGKASVSCTFYALRQLPYCVLADLTVSAKKNIEITTECLMDAPSELINVQNYFHRIGKAGLLTSEARSPTGKLKIAASTAFLFDDTAQPTPSVIWDSTKQTSKFKIAIKAGTHYHFSVAGATISTAHTDDPLNEAERYVVYQGQQGASRLISRHRSAWHELWESDIIIEGDDASQRDVHAALYHLYAFIRPETSYSISPMGLSGLGYNGHIFWDAELWMFPVMLVLHPEMAKSMMEYRYQRLEQARQNAFAHGFRGAMYPWESAATGSEETPVWALTGPLEHHITADVAIAAWNYYSVTQDTVWLRTKGFPMIQACADFWVSRVEKGAQGRYGINNVVAADEWAENVDNNAFTNAAARTNLQYAVKAAEILEVPADPRWNKVGKNIPILKLNNGVTAEHANYKGEKIKQADVNLLAYPLREITDPYQIKKDLRYYEKRIGEGSPAMTHAIFAVLHARLLDPVSAWNAFKEAYLPNKKRPFGVLAETAGGTNPYFATGAGGFLQSVLFGFGGLDITSSGLRQLNTVLPRHWKSLTLKGIGLRKQTFRKNQTVTDSR